MKLKRNNYLWFFILWLLPLYSSCDLGVENNLLIDDDDELEEREIEFSEPVLSEDGRSVVVKARVNGDIGEYDLANPVQLTSTVSEIFSFTRKVGEAHTIQLSEVKNLSKDYIQSHNVKALVLSDLTMSSFAIDQQRRAIRTMRNQFGNNLYVSFLTEDAISETMLATDYVLDHYCIASDLDALNTPIYRAISTKLDEVNDTTSILNQCDLFALFVFTDGIVWSGDMPVDFDHFNIKRHISDLLQNKLPSGENLCDFFSVVYFDDETRFREDDAYLELLAQNSGGVALDTFNWNTILSALWKKLNVDYFDYELSFVNPETKSLRGWGYQVNVSFSSKDTDICQGSFIYNIGMKTVIFGCGKITKRIAKGFEFVRNNQLVGFASRDIQKAQTYAKEFNVELFGDYDYFLNNKDIDCVYIATYNINHYELIKDCLNHNKHVLCEKPMLSNIKDNEELFELAKKKDCLF